MSLEIKKGPQVRSIRCIIYGPEGIGKSTLASNFPEAVFIDLEHGTDSMDVSRFTTPSNFALFMDLLNSIAQEDVCKTVVIDTADRLEQIVTKYVCEKHQIRSIEDAGYGKGYTYLWEAWQEILKALDKVIDSGKNVVLVAHAQMRKFEQPDEMGAYDRWELKLSKKTAPLIKEWSDMLLFCNYKNNIVEDPKTKSKKARGGKRVMYATHSPVYDAKNRFGLPDEMEMTFDAIASCFKEVPQKSIADELRELYSEVGEEAVIKFCHDNDAKLRDDAVSFDTLPPFYITFLKGNSTKIIKKINSTKQEES